MNSRKLLSLILIALSLSVSCSSTVVQSDKQTPPNCLEDLRGHKLAVLTGSVQDIMLSEQGYSKDLVRLSTPSDMFAAVTSETAEFLILDSTSVIGANVEERGLAYMFSSEPAGPYGFGFRKSSTDICNELNSFIKEIKANGIYAEISRRWLDGEFLTNPIPEYSYDPNGKRLIIGISNFYPFEFLQDGKWVGFDMDIIYAFCQEYGYVPSVMNADFSALIPALVSGKIDIIASALSVTEERAKSILFSDSYYDCHSCTFAMGYKYFDTFQKSESSKGGFFDSVKQSFYNNFIVDNRYKLVLQGLWETIVISFFAILLGAILGAFVCMLKFSKNKVVKGVTNGFCTFICGIPILVLLMVMFYIVFAQSAITARVVAIIAFAINFACSISSVYYSGISSIDKGQTEAGLALGFTPVQTFFNFILPQASRNILPLFKGESVSLIKNTSIVGYIAIQDLTKISDIIRSRTFDAFFPLISISIIYFILAWGFAKLIDSISKVKA